MAKTTLVSTPKLTDTIESARAWIRKHAWGGGVTCPVCDQRAQVYKRTINAGMAKSLIAIYRIAGDGSWFSIKAIDARSREEGKLAYWGLLEEQKAARPDGGRAGYWRLTQRGIQFVKGQMAVSKYALVYNGNCLGFEGPPVDIRAALGKHFDYAELMSS